MGWGGVLGRKRWKGMKETGRRTEGTKRKRREGHSWQGGWHEQRPEVGKGLAWL